MKQCNKTWMWMGCLFVALFFVGCPKSNDTKNGNTDGNPANDKPKFEAYSSGIGKYDSYFRRVYDLRYKLWKSDKQVNGVPGTLRSVLDTPGDVKKAGVGEILKMIVAKYGSKLSFVPGTGIRLNSGENDPKAAKVATTLDQVYQTTYKMPTNLGGAVDQSKQLVVRGQQLTQSVPKDFTGFNALKAPRVTAELASSTKEMGLVPAQVAKIGTSAFNVAKQFPAVFRSQK